MKIQISHEGLRLQEHLRALQSAFQDGALGRVVPSAADTIAVDAPAEDEEAILRLLRRTARESGFIILQDDERFRDLDTRHYLALTPVH